MLLMSKAGLAPLAALHAESPCDNVLLEYNLALELKARGVLAAIFPVLVGDLKQTEHVGLMYADFFKCGAKPSCQPVAVKRVQEKLHEHLERLELLDVANDASGTLRPDNKNSDTAAAARGVQATLDSVLRYQGVFLVGVRDNALREVVQEVSRVAFRHRPTGRSRAASASRGSTGSRPNSSKRPLSRSKGAGDAIAPAAAPVAAPVAAPAAEAEAPGAARAVEAARAAAVAAAEAAGIGSCVRTTPHPSRQSGLCTSAL